MTRMRTRIARVVPKALVPIGRRLMRRVDRFRGARAASARPGVVLMLHVGRCGSTVLADLLGQHPRIHWDGKLPRVAKGLYGARLGHMDFPAWTRTQFEIAGDRFYGFEFKVLEDQYPAVIGMTTPEFLAACREIGVTHYVLLVRRNTLRHVVSHYAAMNKGAWHSSGGTAKKKSFTLDIESITTGSAPGRPLVDYLREVEDKHDEVRRLLLGERLLEIEYERDLDEAGAPHAYARICKFLGLEPTAVGVRRARVNPFPLSEILDNHGEVIGALERTEFAWMGAE